ncbi:MAG: tetratricopeptide repeat protein, partial [bacterium]
SDISEFENAIKTYIKGREILAQNNAIYADELSMLYVQVGNVKDGIKEIANVFKQQQQYGIIQGRISALLTNEEAQSIIENELTKYSSNDFSFSRVYVWFLRETKQLDKAYAQALLIDNTLGLQGRELLEFAEITLKDGLFDIAMKAYGNILDRGKNNPHFSQALYGYAKAMDQRLQSSKSSLDEAEVRLIINRYYDIIAQSPQGTLIADCLYRIAMLELTNARNPTEAKKLFLRIVQTYPQYQVSATAANQLADLHIMFNSLDESLELSTKTAQQYQFSFPAEADKANFLRAEIMLFKGEIDSCKNILIGLAGKTESDIANDALELSLFLEQHKQFQAGLISWGKARFLERKKEFQQSVNAYREIALQTKGTELGEQAEMRACMILRTFNPQESLSEAQKFILNYPESMYTDSMLFMMAEIMIEQHHNAEAIAVLTDILVRFPTSQFVRKSRELIRSLRGDS